MRVLFFSPHPDDIELFCGGTFLRHVADGDRIAAVMVTKGGAGTLNPALRGERLESIRVAECQRRFAEFPDVELLWLGQPDGRVVADAAAVAPARHFVADFDAELIYLPESTASRSYYKHHDHLCTGRIAERTLDTRGSPVTLRYYHSRHVNRLVDIDPFYRESKEALRCYASQYRLTAKPPCVLLLLELARAVVVRQRGRRAGCRYAEGFREQAFQPGASFHA